MMNKCDYYPPIPPPTPISSSSHSQTHSLSFRTLSSHALDALKEFYADRDARAKQFEQLKAEAEDKAATAAQGQGESGGGGGGASAPAESKLKYPLSMEAFTEDWNESQFWVS